MAETGGCVWRLYPRPGTPTPGGWTRLWISCFLWPLGWLETLPYEEKMSKDEFSASLGEKRSREVGGGKCSMPVPGGPLWVSSSGTMGWMAFS